MEVPDRPGEARQRARIEEDASKLHNGTYFFLSSEEEYGGGTVLIWDRGGYSNLKEVEEDGEQKPKSVSRQIEDGHVTIWLEGRKLSGGYTRTGGGKNARWLLIKMDDDGADARRNPTSTEPRSVKTSRTLKNIRKEEGKKDA